MNGADEAAYGGVDNLEVMAEARNYNAFLAALVLDRSAPGDRLLDFGAGTGTLAQAIAAEGRSVACIEPDSRLRELLAASGFKAYADAASAPDGFDLAYSFNVIEHIDDDVGALAALRGRLRPGGRLVVYVPAFAVLYTAMDRKVGHKRRYRLKGLAAAVAAAGFTVELVRYCDSLGFLATLAYKLLGRDDGAIDRRALVLYDRIAFPASRALDRVAGRLFGKNLMLIARR